MHNLFGGKIAFKKRYNKHAKINGAICHVHKWQNIFEKCVNLMWLQKSTGKP